MLRTLAALPRSFREVALCAALVTHSVAATAQQTEDPSQVAARALGYAGIDAYEAGDFETAAQRLDAAYTTLRVPSLGLWSARAFEKQGRWVAAAQRLTEVTQLPLAAGELQIQRQAQADAVRELAELQAKLPHLTVRLINASAEQVQVTVDDLRLDSSQLQTGVAVDPGERRVVGTRAEQRVEALVTLIEAQRGEAILNFPSPAPPMPNSESGTTEGSAQRSAFVYDPLPWILIGAGGAALVTAGVTLGLALDDEAAIEANPNCRGRQCLRSEAQLVDRFNALSTTSDVAFIGGGLLVAAGLTLWVIDATNPNSTRVHTGASTLWVTGTF